MTSERLAEIRVLAERVQGQQWRRSVNDIVIEATSDGHFWRVVGSIPAGSDREFIAAAPEMVHDLLDEIDRLTDRSPINET